MEDKFEMMPVCQYCGRAFWGAPMRNPICIPCMDDADRMQVSEEIDGLCDFLDEGMATPLIWLMRDSTNEQNT